MDAQVDDAALVRRAASEEAAVRQAATRVQVRGSRGAGGGTRAGGGRLAAPGLCAHYTLTTLAILASPAPLDRPRPAPSPACTHHAPAHHQAWRSKQLPTRLPLAPPRVPADVTRQYALLRKDPEGWCAANLGA